MSKKTDLLSEINFQIFDNIHEPTSIYELIRDENNDVINLRLLYTNTASKLNIKKKNIGSTLSEYDGDSTDNHLKMVNDVISTGRSIQYETYFAPLNKHYLVLNFVYKEMYITISVDISRQKKHENQLKESEKRYHALFKNNYAPMLLINPETGDIIDANPAACSFYGYNRKELIKMKIKDLNILTEGQIFKEMQRAKSEKRNHFTFKHRLANGELRDVDTYSGPIIVGGKKFLYSIIHDITRQKKAEKSLKRERELLQAIIDKIPVMITIYDPQVENMQVNKAFEEITGWTNEEIQDLDIMKVVYPDPDYRLKVAEFMQSLRGWKDVTMTIKDGSQIESSWANVRIPDGRQVGIGIDITERKKIEQQISEALNFNQEIISSSPLGIAVYDELGQCIMANEAAPIIIGATHKEFTNQNFNYLESWHKSGLFDAAKTVMENGIEISGDTHIITTFGKEAWFEYHFSRFLLNGKNHLLFIFNDINERKKLEEQLKAARDNLEEQVKDRTAELEEAYNHLKESAEKYRELVENANSIIIRLDREGNIIFFNEFAEAFFGFREEEVKGKNIVGTIVPKAESYGRDLQLLMNKIISNPENYSYVENENITKDKKRVWVSWTNKGIFNKERKVQGILSIGTDITERKKAEKNIKDQAELLNLTHEAIIVRDLNGKILFWNDGASEIYGWNKYETLGKTIHKLLQTIFPQHLNEIMGRVIHTNQWNGELIHKTRDGSQIIVSSRWTLKRDEKGNPVSILEINSDITNRKKAEEDLKRSETILQEATRLSKVGAYEWDIKNDKFTFSKEWMRIHGIKEKYLSSEELMTVSHPEDRAQVKKALDYALKDIKSYDIEHRIINQLSGEVRYIHAMGTVSKDEKCNPLKMYGVADDITESKLAEIERENLIKDLKQTNEELRQFAYITSHDLQEPLRTMSSYAGLLKNRYEGKLDQDADDFIEFMVSGAARMKAMIQGLLDYSRVGTHGGEFKNFNMEDALNYAMSDLMAFINENNAKITHSELPVVYADENQITRVFQNLIENAIKFRKPNENPKIHVSAQKSDDEYVFSVSDNSIGMEPEYTDKIFEIFKRLHSIGEYEGAGIGLAIVKRIIDRHGGRVWVRSKLGKGSTFYFTIPLTRKTCKN